jgi:MFS transporter
MDQSIPDSNRRSENSTLILAAFAIAAGSLEPGFPVMFRALGQMSPVQVSAANTAHVWAILIFSPVGGLLADRLRGRIVVFGGLVGWLAMLVVGMLARQGQSFGAPAGFVRGALAATVFAAAMYVVAEQIPPERRSGAFVWMTIAPLLMAPLALIGSSSYLRWLGWLTWRGGFGIVAAAGAIIAAAWLLLYKDQPSGGEPETEELYDGRLRWIALAAMVGVATLWQATCTLINQWFAFYIQVDVSYPLVRAGASDILSIIALRNAISISTVPLALIAGGWLANRWSRRRDAAQGRAWIGLAGFGFAAISISFNLAISSPLTAALVTALSRAGLWFVTGVFWTTASCVIPMRKGMALGLAIAGTEVGAQAARMALNRLAGTLSGWTKIEAIMIAASASSLLLWYLVDRLQQKKSLG